MVDKRNFQLWCILLLLFCSLAWFGLIRATLFIAYNKGWPRRQWLIYSCIDGICNWIITALIFAVLLLFFIVFLDINLLPPLLLSIDILSINAFGREVFELVLFFHVIQKLFKDHLIVVILLSHLPNLLNHLSGKLSFNNASRYWLIKYLINLPLFHPRVFIKSLCFGLCKYLLHALMSWSILFVLI